MSFVFTMYETNDIIVKVNVIFVNFKELNNQDTVK